MNIARHATSSAISRAWIQSAQQEFLPPVGTTNLLSFDAITGNQGGAIPPDTNGSIGSTQYVLITNFDYAVYAKTDGHQILAAHPHSCHLVRFRRPVWY